jgi:hypothetical protein
VEGADEEVAAEGIGAEPVDGFGGCSWDERSGAWRDRLQFEVLDVRFPWKEPWAGDAEEDDEREDDESTDGGAVAAEAGP